MSRVEDSGRGRKRLGRLAAFGILGLAVCALSPSGIRAQAEPARFDAYWRRGKAELTSFRLLQARYGEVHEGHAVLIFVLEDMRPVLQVKDESADPSSRGSIPVMKLNRIEKFATGFYDYSMMASVFHPLGPDSLPLKITASIQEWCGHVFQQMNRRSDGWRVRLHSYFEKEADSERKLPGVLTEDGLWVRIRLGPSNLPTGVLDIVPGLFDTRLRHRELAVRKAEAALLPNAKPIRVIGEKGGEEPASSLLRYRLEYSDPKRSLEIVFEKDFPWRIQGWEERYVDRSGKEHRTAAERGKVLMSDYWNRRFGRFAGMRKEFGLPDMKGK